MADWQSPERSQRYVSSPAVAGMLGAQELVKVKAADGTLLGLRLGSNFDTREKVERPYEESGWVHACLKPWGQAVGGVELQFWKGDPRKDKNAKPLPDEHPLVALFKRPSPMATQAQFLEAGVIHRKLWGENFWLLIGADGKPSKPDARGQIDLPRHIWSVPGSAVTHQCDPKGYVKSWRISTKGGEGIEALPEAIVQFRDYDPHNPLRGLGDVQAALSDIDLEWQATRYQRSIIKNSGDPGGFIAIEGQLAPDEAEATEQEATEQFGPHNAGKWKVIPGKGVTYTPNKLGPRDMEFRVMHAWIRDKIASILGVPPAIIGVLDRATFNNIDQMVEMFWKGGNGVLGYLHSEEDVINGVFLPRVRGAEGIVARFDISKIKALQEDESATLELAGRLASMPLGLSFEEALALVRLDRDTSKHEFPGTRLVSAGLVPIEAALAAPSWADEEEPLLDEEGNPIPPAQPTEGAPAAAPGAPTTAGAVQDTALNGAQIAALAAIVQSVADQQLHPEAAIGMILAAFPTISEERARAIIEAAKKTEKPKVEPEPDPNGAPPTGAPPKPAPAAEDDDEPDPKPEKSLALAPQRRSEDEAFAERRRYWDAVEERVAAKGRTDVQRDYLSWRRPYEKAVLARVRSYARHGKSAVRFRTDPRFTRADETGGSSWNPDDVDPLLPSQPEWASKMGKKMRGGIQAVLERALADMAAELGVDPISAQSPRVLRYLEEQVIKLSDGHIASMTEKVRKVLVESLSGAMPGKTLQEALTEVLPELEGNLKLAFADRESRAATIAQTEVNKATNGGRVIEMEAEGITAHEWITSRDAAVRGTPGGPYEDSEFSHAELDGQTAAIGSEFPGHAGLKFPCDPDADPGDTINCRCLTRAVRPKD